LEVCWIKCNFANDWEVVHFSITKWYTFGLPYTPSDRICHIHGSVDDDEVIVGHVRWKKPEDYNAQSDEKEIVCREFLKVLNKLNKETDEQIGSVSFILTN
jgi:hypothetical protein